jgi:hypothetical protein
MHFPTLVAYEMKNSNTIPLEIYHGVPSEWSKKEMIEEHRRLGGCLSIEGADATEAGAPYFLPDRHNWLQYRQTLYRICDGIRKNDLACVELGIRYIELNYIGSYSGFIREKIARALKSIKLSSVYAERLRKHFKKLIEKNECFEEFAEYKKLLNKLDSNKGNT